MQTADPTPSRNEAAVPFIKKAGDGGVRVILDALEKKTLFLLGIETRFFGRPALNQSPFRMKMLKISSLCVHAGAAEDRLLGHYFLPPRKTGTIL